MELRQTLLFLLFVQPRCSAGSLLTPGTCTVTTTVSRPVLVSHTATRRYPCCPNLACHPPVCSRQQTVWRQTTAHARVTKQAGIQSRWD